MLGFDQALQAERTPTVFLFLASYFIQGGAVVK